VELLGVATSLHRQANHGVAVDADQAASLADTDTLLQVGQDRDGFVLGQPTVKQGRTPALAEALLASAASQHAAFAGPVAERDAEVACIALAKISAGGVLTAKIL